MSVEHVEVRSGGYADSLTLMQVSAAASAVTGVRAAMVAMGTELNLGLLRAMEFALPAGGDSDLFVAVRADSDAALAATLAAIESGLDARRRPTGGGGLVLQPPRTFAAATRAAGTGLALISVPGPHAFVAAMDALGAGCDVMIFSDNVRIDQEIILKETAAERGLLVMGPDCGTAVVGGLGLGFANAVARGSVGVVAASGTGAQQLLCLLDAAGAGISAALGVGGRDLSEEVGGRSARAALAALDADEATELIIMVSKPPAPGVADQLRSYAKRLSTPVQFALIGSGEPDLTAAAEATLRALGMRIPQWSSWQPGGDGRAGSGPGALRGLFSGGTLCDEAMVIASERLGPVFSNIPLRPQWRLGPGLAGPGLAGPGLPAAPAQAGELGPAGSGRHIMIDFGDDELTAGRPHPMIDQSLRLERLAAQAADPATAVIMLDVVLGYGAHQDPAGQVGPAIAAARASRGVPVVVSLIGTPADPQGLDRQAATLAAAGAHVFASNAQAARFACDLIGDTR